MKSSEHIESPLRQDGQDRKGRRDKLDGQDWRDRQNIDDGTGGGNNVFGNYSTYGRYFRKCVMFAKSYTYDEVVAENIASESMLVFWNKYPELEPDVPQLPYLLGIVRNKVLNYLRSKRSEDARSANIQEDAMREMQYRIDTLEECDPHSLFDNEIRKILSDALSEMNDNARKAFILNRYNGLSYREISIILGISQKTVEYHMARAISLVRGRLKDYLPLIAILLSL